jgi:hypothetical protein
MKRLAAAAALALLLGVAPAAARDDFQSGVWAGRAHPPNGGPFTHCTINAEYQNGISLTFFITRDYRFGIYMFSAAWSLTKGDSYDVAYAVDGGRRSAAKARAVTGNGVMIDLSAARGVFDQLKAGAVLLIEAAGGSFRFDLGGTNAALERLLVCVNRNLQVAGRSPGGGSVAGGGQGRMTEPAERPQQRRETPERRAEGAPRRSVPASPEDRARASAFVEKLLLRAELYSFEILSGEKVPPDLRGFDVVWTGYHVIGMLDIVPQGLYRSIDRVASDTIEGYRQTCQGKLSVQDHVLRLDDGRNFVQIAVVCTAGKDEAHLDYTLVPIADGVYYRIGHLSDRDPAAGRAANDRIGRVLPAMLSGK